MKELDFVLKFKKYCKMYDGIRVVHIEENPNSIHMDCELEFKDQYVRLEAKMFNDVRSKSQNAIKIYGGILKGRKLNPAKNSGLPSVYGILIRKSEISEAIKRFKTVACQDWDMFGVCFDVKYVFIFDEKKSSLKIVEWNNFTA